MILLIVVFVRLISSYLGECIYIYTHAQLRSPRLCVLMRGSCCTRRQVPLCLVKYTTTTNKCKDRLRIGILISTPERSMHFTVQSEWSIVCHTANHFSCTPDTLTLTAGRGTTCCWHTKFYNNYYSMQLSQKFGRMYHIVQQQQNTVRITRPHRVANLTATFRAYSYYEYYYPRQEYQVPNPRHTVNGPRVPGILEDPVRRVRGAEMT